MRANRKPHVCFVAPSAYSVLSNRPDLCHFGGAERQQVLIARELVRRGYQVSFVTLDHGQPDGIVHDGIRVFKMCSWKDGLPGVRFIHPRWTSLAAAMRRAQADVYYQRTAGSETGQVGIWCKRHGRPFLFACASDSDCDPRLPYLRNRRERLLYRFGVRLAMVVLTQTMAQVRTFRKLSGIEPVLVRSCCADPYEGRDFQRPPSSKGRPMLLWIGRFSPEKRPEMFIDLAEVCPEFDFSILGAARTETRYVKSLIRRAEKLPNITLHGYVPRDELRSIYERATLLVCTSKWEGFPNTFMEAWALGLQVASTVDPDGVITENRLGFVGASAAELKEGIHKFLASPDLCRNGAERVRRFFLGHHTVNATVDAYEALLTSVSSGFRCGSARTAMPPVEGLL